jgi:predicted phosphodiesterase
MESHRVAALYDIHGNLPALEAVLRDVVAAHVDRVVVGGDVVPGPMPTECLELLLGLEVPVNFIHGNGESAIISHLRGDGLDAIPEPFQDAMRWVAQAIPPEHAAEYGRWPGTCSMKVAGLGRVLFCHATPRNDTEIFTRNTPAERLLPVFEGVEADLVVCGHTHMQFDRQVSGTRVVNAGSVGMPFGAPGAYWLLLDSTIQLRRTDYDVANAEARIRTTDYPGAEAITLASPPSEAEILLRFDAAAVDDA